MKIRTPDGREVGAEDIDFEVMKEDWNEYKLKDGTTLRVKTVVTSIIRTEDHDPMTGDPTYIIKSGNMLRAIVPENLKRVPSPKKSSGVEVR